MPETSPGITAEMKDQVALDAELTTAHSDQANQGGA